MNKPQVDLIKAYIAKAQDKVSVARELLDHQHYDDAASRAYYAAFHMAQPCLQKASKRGVTKEWLRYSVCYL